MKYKVMLVLLLISTPLTLLVGQEKTTKDNFTVKVSDDTKVAVPRRGLSRLQRRQLGLTIENIRTSAKKLEESGVVDSETSISEAAALVANDLKSRNNTAFADANLDWESILNWIELILKLIGMFS